ncbi:MAG: hypothetical protein KUG79_03705 [Pseudomonadales bacterium]|nr:hypothetical protein [Pseudomonadales bacterium]
MHQISLDLMKHEIHGCTHCPRLRHYLKTLRDIYPDYWNRPVAASGPEDAGLLIVGLAPGKHGANKTGVPFTGDASGTLLFDVLAQLKLIDKVRITNAVKCVPRDNKPSGKELNNCQKFLHREIIHHQRLPGPRVILALGQVAHRAIIKSLLLAQKDYLFGHGAVHPLRLDEQRRFWLVNSYHCSRYNTQTGRLTEAMFLSAVETAASYAFDGI